MMNQKQKILDYISRFGSITAYEAFSELGITQLAARIKELKENDGIPIYGKLETRKNRYGEKVSIKRYFLGEPKEA